MDVVQSPVLFSDEGRRERVRDLWDGRRAEPRYLYHGIEDGLEWKPLDGHIECSLAPKSRRRRVDDDEMDARPLRHGFITASRVPAIVGEAPSAAAQLPALVRVWRGDADAKAVPVWEDAVRHGSDNELVALRALCTSLALYGAPDIAAGIRHNTETIVHPDPRYADVFSCTPDALHPKSQTLFEIKCPYRADFGGLPKLQHVLQATHQLEVTGYKRAWLVYWARGMLPQLGDLNYSLRVFQIDADCVLLPYRLHVVPFLTAFHSRFLKPGVATEVPSKAYLRGEWKTETALLKYHAWLEWSEISMPHYVRPAHQAESFSRDLRAVFA